MMLRSRCVDGLMIRVLEASEKSMEQTPGAFSALLLSLLRYSSSTPPSDRLSHVIASRTHSDHNHIQFLSRLSDIDPDLER